MEMRALFLNCTLKKSPQVSNTQALFDKAVNIFKDLGVECRRIRVVDYNIPFLVSSNEGEGDKWPFVLEQIRSCDIFMIRIPIWFGLFSSVVKPVIERLDGIHLEGDPKTGQYPLHSKVAGVIVTGNEDRAHDVCSNILFSLIHLGCTVPPNADCYWVGDAGPGPSYIEVGGDKHLYTNRTVR